MKIIEIEDLTVKELGGVNKVAKYIEANPIEYHLSSGAARCRVTFGDEQNMQIDVINLDFTPEEMNAWGEDDSYIENLILSKIGASKKVILDGSDVSPDSGNPV